MAKRHRIQKDPPTSAFASSEAGRPARLTHTDITARGPGETADSAGHTRSSAPSRVGVRRPESDSPQSRSVRQAGGASSRRTHHPGADAACVSYHRCARHTIRHRRTSGRMCTRSSCRTLYGKYVETESVEPCGTPACPPHWERPAQSALHTEAGRRDLWAGLRPQELRELTRDQLHDDPPQASQAGGPAARIRVAPKPEVTTLPLRPARRNGSIATFGRVRHLAAHPKCDHFFLNSPATMRQLWAGGHGGPYTKSVFPPQAPQAGGQAASQRLPASLGASRPPHCAQRFGRERPLGGSTRPSSPR